MTILILLLFANKIKMKNAKEKTNKGQAEILQNLENF